MTQPIDPTAVAKGPRQSGFKRAMKLVGVSFYVLVVRIALAAVALALWGYFAVNSGFVAGQIADLVNSALPGTVEVAHIQWGPQPGYVRIIKPAVKAPDGTLVLKAEWLDVQVQWWQLFSDIASGADTVRVRVLSARLVAPHIRLDNDAEGRLKLALAFSDPNDKPTDDDGAPFSFIIDHLSARELSYYMDLDGNKIVLKGGECEARLQLEKARGKPLALTWETQQLSIGHAQMWLKSFEDSGLEQLPGGTIVVQSISGTLDRIDLQGMSIALPHIHLDRGDTVVQLKPTLDVTGSQLRMTASTQAPFFGKMLGPLFDCSASLDGGYRFSQGGAFSADATLVAKGKISGLQTDSVRADISMKLGHNPPPKDPEERVEKMIVVSKNVEISGFKGRMSSPSLTYQLFSDGLQRTFGDISSDKLSLGQFVASPVLNIPGAIALAMQGRLSGTIQHHLDLRLPKEKGGVLDMVVKLDSDLQLHRADEGVLYKEALPRLHLRGGVDYAMGPQRGTSLQLRELALSNRRDDVGPRKKASDQWVALDGLIDLGKSAIELKTDIHLPDLTAWLVPLGVKGVSGRLSLRHAHVHGDLMKPTVQAKLDGHELTAAGWKIDEIHAGLGLRDGVLSFVDTQLAMLGGEISGHFDVHLFGSDLKTVHKLPKITAVDLKIAGLPLRRLMEQTGTKGLSATVDLSGGKLSVDLRDPVKTLALNGQVRLRDVEVPLQRFTKIETRVAMKSSQLTLGDLKMILPAAGHGQKPSEVTGSVSLDMSNAERPSYSAKLAFTRMNFDQIGYLRGLKLPMRGGIAGTLTVSGNTADMAFDTDIAIDELAWDKIHMGAGQVRMVKKLGEKAVMTSRRFFKGFDLLEGSDVTFKRLIPMQIGMQLRAHELDPFEFLGLEPMPGATIKVSAKSLFGLDFRPGHDVFFVDAEIPSGGLTIELEGGLHPLSNKGISRMKILPDRVVIRSTRVTIGREQLEMCGEFLYANEPKKLPARLQLYLGGKLDVPRFDVLAESMASMDMRLKIQPTPALKGDTKAWCLRKPAAGVMRIAGPLTALEIDGRIRLLPSTLVPRGLGKEVLLAGGGELDLRTDSKHRMIVTIPDNRPIEGRVEDGRFRTFGTARLVGYKPDEIDFRFDAEDYEYVEPKTFLVVATPSLRFLGKKMLTAKPDMLLSGNVEVNEAAYIKSHDRIGAIGKGVLSREASRYSEPFLDRHPEYKALKLKLVVNGRNIEVTSKFPFLRTDVELAAQNVRVGGTLGAMRVDGRLEISHGSSITYELFKREFEVEKGFLDFGGNVLNPQLQIVARTDIAMGTTDNAQGSTLSIGPGFASGGGGGSSRQNTVRVKVGVNGLLFDPTKAERGELELNKKLDINLSSTPPYDQSNLMALILTGRLLTGGSAGQSAGLGFLTNELSEIFASTLLSSFVKLDKFEVAPTIDGGAQFNFQQRLGQALSLAYKGSKGGAEESSEARFDFRLSENWSMEGLARTTFSTQYNQRIYSATLRYRVPLETFQELFGL